MSRSITNVAAYSMTEIAIVFVVIGALATLAIPNFTVTAEKTRSAEGVQIASAIWQANQLHILETVRMSDFQSDKIGVMASPFTCLC